MKGCGLTGKLSIRCQWEKNSYNIGTGEFGIGISFKEDLQSKVRERKAGLVIF